MKNLILILITTMTLISCSKDTFDGNDQLPAATQTGANTVGCLVNGKVFLPHAEGINPEVNCFYQLVNGEFYFTLRFSDFRNGRTKSVKLDTRKISLQVGQTYVLNKNMVNDGDFAGGDGLYWDDPSFISYTNLIKIGELKISRLDLSNSIISGTFWFDAINTTGETVHITQGRFDWNY